MAISWWSLGFSLVLYKQVQCIPCSLFRHYWDQPFLSLSQLDKDALINNSPTLSWRHNSGYRNWRTGCCASRSQWKPKDFVYKWLGRSNLETNTRCIVLFGMSGKSQLVMSVITKSWRWRCRAFYWLLRASRIWVIDTLSTHYRTYAKSQR